MLRATDDAHVDAVTSGLRVSARVGEITTCRNDTELRSELHRRAPDDLPDFVVLVVSHNELPPYLLRYPDLRVLVLTTYRKVGSLTPWLQQGASDVASLARPQQVQHALGRMIDESALERRVSLLADELTRSEARYSTLIENSSSALSYWRDDELVVCSQRFTDITGLDRGATVFEWCDTLQPKSTEALASELEHFPQTLRASLKDSGRTIKIAKEPLCEASDDNEFLISVKWVVPASDKPGSEKNERQQAHSLAPSRTVLLPSVPHVELTPSADSADLANSAGEVDSASGLPERQTVINHFQGWLQSGNEENRYVAMTVDLAENNSQGSGGITSTGGDSTLMRDKTLNDLAVYRAADRLTQTLRTNTLLGRLSDHQLLVIKRLANDEAPRMLAAGIRQSLGSLGGLLGSDDAVRINTVNICGKPGTSAEGLVSRLENRSVRP